MTILATYRVILLVSIFSIIMCVVHLECIDSS